MKQNDTQPDEFHGVGGSYVIDPDTGLRRRAEEVIPEAHPCAPLPNPLPQAGEGTNEKSNLEFPAAAQTVKTPRSK